MVSMNYFDKIAEKVKTLVLNKRDQYYFRVATSSTKLDNS